jgi:acyl carrier protein phosphodiesterase
VNHLAHLRLSPPDPHWRLGALLGDFVRGTDLSAHPDGVRRGIELHRAIDSFTDAHPVFAQSRRRIDGPLRRFSGVLVDVFYDHFLLRRWDEIGSGEHAAAFASDAYALLRDHRELLHGAIHTHLDRMIENRWLEKSADLEGVRTVLGRIAMRMRREVALEDGAELLRRDYDAFADDFDSFWPDVEVFARTRSGFVVAN